MKNQFFTLGSFRKTKAMVINMIYYVSKKASGTQNGSVSAPFLTIQQAADIAMPGDTVIVCEGVYRERVCPVRSGFNEHTRIAYIAKDGDKVIIKGSEEIGGWVFEGGLWHASIDNGIFKGENPFARELKGERIAVPPRVRRTLTPALFT